MRQSRSLRRTRSGRQTDLDDGFARFLSEAWENYYESTPPVRRERLADWLLRIGCPDWMLWPAYAVSLLRRPNRRVPPDPELAFQAYLGQTAAPPQERTASSWGLNSSPR